MTTENPFQKTVISKLREGTLSQSQEARLKRYLEFDLPPRPTDPLDAIVVLGTSPTEDSTSFYMRVNDAIRYSSQFPDAPVIFSGRRPHESRATEQEMTSEWVEAEVMKDVAVRQGLPAAETIVEGESVNSKENVNLSLEMLLPRIQKGEINNILFITSSYAARRINFYVLKALKKLGVNQKIEHFIVDGDVKEDRNPDRTFTTDELIRKRRNLIYEWERLPEYRKRGDL
jgi:uncharacterized SAM-binding protein YcdF (DUF218 family)